MDLLRHDKDAWGQQMLVGVSWDIAWLPVAAAGVVIVVHLALRHRRARTTNRTTNNGARPRS